MLAVKFGQALGLATGDLAFALQISSSVAELTLAGRASEMVTRNRGRAHFVAPLFSMTDGIFIWTGYRELWKKKDTEQKFRFGEAGFTLHIGRQGELLKPQILRSEWVGRSNATFNNGAGHPHWQLDALESARSDFSEITVRFSDPDVLRPAQEFSGEPLSVSGDNLVLSLTVERMHLASAALWWRTPSVSVAHLPETVIDIDRWILGCIAYLRQEVGRCGIVSQRK